MHDEAQTVELSVPRDRKGEFEPQLIERYQRRFPEFSDKILALYAAGLSTRDIGVHVGDLYGIGISPALVSAVTASVSEEVRAWQSRPLERTYALAFFDALRVKIHDEGVVRNKAVYLAIGVRCSGHRELLGMWIEQEEGAKFWSRILNDLRVRGVQDILIAIVDGLKGFPEAIESQFPQTVVQTCIVHLLRHSMRFVSWKERKAIAVALKEIYRAPNAEAAAERLAAFEQSPLGQKHPPIAECWRRQWAAVIPFFSFSPGVRRIIYTANAIESLHNRVRKAVRNRDTSPATRPPARRSISPSCALSANGRTPSPDGTMLKCSSPSSSASAFASRIKEATHEIPYRSSNAATHSCPQPSACTSSPRRARPAHLAPAQTQVPRRLADAQIPALQHLQYALPLPLPLAHQQSPPATLVAS